VRRSAPALVAMTVVVVAAAIAGACGGAIDPNSATVDASTAEAGALAEAGTLDCPATDDVPATLACTGLYADIGAKTLAAGIRPYAPAVALWADGAGKSRWVALPEGSTIDASVPGEWSFPVGTRFWKEFAVGGRRVETRYFVKLRPTYWARATYAWNADESGASRAAGGDIVVDGAPYHVPTPTECDQCHKGRSDRILGFEEVLLGLDGASGLTLASLAAERRLAPAPARTRLSIGDDGTGAAAPALAWLHVNCGVSCHSPNSNALGYGTGLRLRLDATQLDGTAARGWGPLATTENVPATTPAWSGELRIVPGHPDESLLVKLMSTRSADGKGQMPPLATRTVDPTALADVTAWIAKMPHAEIPDAGGGDASPPETEAGAPDAGDVDAGIADSGAPDAQDAADARAPVDASADAQDGGGGVRDAAADAAPTEGGPADATIDGLATP
jgi:hypothetical protein